MLALPRAFGTDPKLVMLDELSIGLAFIVVRQLDELATQLATQGLSILVVEQFARTVLPIADSVAVMLQGQIVRAGYAGRSRRRPVVPLPGHLGACRPLGLRVRLRVPRRPRARTPSPRRTGDSLRRGAGPDW